MTRKPRCANDACDDILREGSACGLCAACYQRAYYWSKRSVKDKMQYTKRLRRSAATLDDSLGNISVLRAASSK